MIDWPYFVQNYLSLIDVTMMLVWLTIITIATFFIQINIKDRLTRKYYSWNVLFKIVFAFAFGFYYGGVFKGGDSIEYWRAASKMADMFYSSPTKYFKHLMSENNMSNLYYYFNSSTGYPSSDIYGKPENYFTCKVFSVFAIITYKSYFAGTFIMAYLSAHVHWRLFRMIKKSHLETSSWMPILFLFTPSVSFWASGISKDTLLLMGTFSIVYWVYSILWKQKKISLHAVVAILLTCYIILHVRSTILIIAVVPFLFSAMRQVYMIIGNEFLKRITQVAFNGLIVIGLILFLLSSTKDTIILENASFTKAMVTQDDFTNNKTYGQNKYNLKLEDASFFGIVAKTPMIIATGIYRPFLWEALSIALILNGIESVVLIIFSWRFILQRLRARVRLVLKDGFLRYSMVFVLLTAFVSGFISIIFGVLVRFRMPLLPFIGLLLTVEPPKENNKQLK